MAKIAFISAGAPFHGRNLCTEVQGISDSEGFGWECSFLEWQRDGYDSYGLDAYDWLWNVGNFENVFGWFAEFRTPRKIAMWVGTDILQHTAFAQRGVPDPFGAADLHIADAPNLVRAAQGLTGLDVGYVRSIPPVSYEPVDVASWDDVLGYVPADREQFFRHGWFLDLARDYPDIRFHLLGRGDTPNKTGLENVVHEKQVSGEDKRKLFESCFAYLRPCEHDGVGLTLIELAQLGRFVFHSDTTIPYVLPGRSVGEIEYWLDTIRSRRANPPAVVSQFYRDNYSLAALAGDLETLKERMEKMT